MICQTIKMTCSLLQKDTPYWQVEEELKNKTPINTHAW